MNGKKPITVACIPAYNEETSIGQVVLSTRNHVDLVVVCDDGSSDATGKIAEGLGAIVVRHDRNLGKGQAVKTLFQTAMQFNPDALVMLDADGQHDPNEIPNLTEPILIGKSDFVIGSRYIGAGETETPIYRRFGLKLLNSMFKRLNKIPVGDAQSGFRALSPKAVDSVCLFKMKGYGVDAELVVLAARNGITITEVPVTVRYKGLKTSKKTPLLHGGELVYCIFEMAAQEHPLLYLGIPGLGLSIVGLQSTIAQVSAFDSTSLLSVLALVLGFGCALFGLVFAASGFVRFALKHS